MHWTIDNFRYKQHAKGRFYQVALWLAVLVLSLQLVGMAFHKHDLAEQSPDCVSCYMAGQLPSGLPKAPAEVLVAMAVVAYRIALLPIYFYIAERRAYLLPPPQAPPSALTPA